MVWFDSIITTLSLCLLTSLLSITVGTITAIIAWWSNKAWAYYMPILLLAVPPWLLTYQISDQFGYINPWLGAVLSLGLCCSVYPHSIIASSLSNRAYKAWEMTIVVSGKNIKSLWMAIYPSIKISIIPSLAIIFAECIADFGVSNFYGLNTVTMLTYNIWTSTWSMSTLWVGLVILSFLGLSISRLDLKSSSPISLSDFNYKNSFYGILAIIPTVLLIGFSIFKSIQWVVYGGQFVSEDFWVELYNTLYLVVVVLIVCFILMVVYLMDFNKRFLEMSGLGFYALPGTVIGAFYLYVFGSFVPLFVLLTLAITTRYYGLMINSLAVADKGNQKYFEVINFYSIRWTDKLKQKVKLILPSAVIGVCLIVLDTIRELPISMILQPMNFQTLAMRMNYIARNEAIPNLGAHSLVILTLSVIMSIIIVGFVYDRNKKSK